MAIETSRRELARRRAAAVAGVGGLWVALLAALGAWWLALGALVLAAGGAGFAWLRTYGSSAAVAGARGVTKDGAKRGDAGSIERFVNCSCVTTTPASS
jgi:hypothetical protein